MNWVVASVLCVSLAIAACAPENVHSSPTLPAPQAVGAPTQPPATDFPPTASSPPPAQAPTSLANSLGPVEVEISGAEGLAIQGTFLAAERSNAPSVLLLHMLGGRRSDWSDLAQQLQEAGIASLAIDQRGHGETGGDRDWELAQQDITLAMAWLRINEYVDAKRTGVIGASIGANLALVVGTAGSDAMTLVSLSPGLDYFSVKTAGLLTEPSEQAVLLVASEDDVYSADTVKQLTEESGSRAELLLLQTAGHGTVILRREPTLSNSLIEFLLLAFGTC